MTTYYLELHRRKIWSYKEPHSLLRPFLFSGAPVRSSGTVASTFIVVQASLANLAELTDA